MEPTDQNINTESQPTTQSSIKKLLKNRPLVIGGVVLVLILILVFAIFPFGQTAQQSESPKIVHLQPTTSVQKDQPSQSPEMQKAVNEAKNASEKFDNWEEENWQKYPWIRKLPLATERYYVYFDLDKNEFIGKLYPVAGDTEEKMKTEIINELKTTYGIPADNFSFEWSVNPQ